ncbi:SSI family serine proteinase inhibitor [Nonomuraea pusilla]|uniref:SSI family serine proteinase inhibitor n=1 Tax=Nonomuraea pusilla TaxID=46177 RepID=UPI0006E3CD41|nr:SSI family serine proteinase inhibitor [Nonomuraea pusilla]
MITVGDRYGLLVCGPAPTSPAACAALERVGGDPALLARRPDASCTMEYAPVKVTARGVWDGVRRRYTHTFPNACELAVTGGSVFSV